MGEIELENVSLSDIVNITTVFNTWTADEKYSVGKSENLGQPIESKLSKKVKALSQFSVVFMESTLSFEHFENKDEPHS